MPDARAPVLRDGRVVLGQELAVEEKKDAEAEPEDRALAPARDLGQAEGLAVEGEGLVGYLVVEGERGLEDPGSARCARSLLYGPSRSISQPSPSRRYGSGRGGGPTWPCQNSTIS